MDDIRLQPLSDADIPAAVDLLMHLNPTTPREIIHQRLAEILMNYPHYHLIGAFSGGTLLGLSGAWIATKVWCGKYLEIDNIVVHPDQRSGKIGTRLIEHLEILAREQQCEILALDSYTSNYPSHRLYHRLGFEIRGFHFIKSLGEAVGSSRHPHPDQ